MALSGSRSLFISLLSLGLIGGLAAQTGKQQTTDQSAKTSAPAAKEEDPLKRPVSDKQQKKNSKALRQELSKTEKEWLEKDVAYIITDEERAAFKQFSNEEERDQFIEAFWQRRDPTPDTEENEFKEEHYRRMAYATDHFAAVIPGWKSDPCRKVVVSVGHSTVV